MQAGREASGSKAPEWRHLYDMENAHIKHHVEQALRAHAIFSSTSTT
jgi:preprotein translocase subunit SecA